MLAKLVGIFSILWGLLCVVRPEFLRGRLLFKAHRYLFWTLFVTLVYPFVHFYGKELGWRGVLAVIGAFAVAMGMLRKKMGEAFQFVPLTAFRAAGAVNVGAGCALLWWPRG